MAISELWRAVRGVLRAAFSAAAVICTLGFLQIAAAAEGPGYRLQITGLSDKSAAALFDELSLLKKSNKADSFSELRYSIRRDVESLTEILRSFGYYGARVSYQLDRSRRPFELRFLVTQGPQFTIESFTVTFVDQPEDLSVLQEAAQSLALSPGTPAVSDRVVVAERAILTRLPEIGHPAVRLERRDVVVDHETAAMRVELRIHAGPPRNFGPPRFTGADDVRTDFLVKLAPWNEGELYDSRKVEELRRKLAETNLFTSIETAVEGADGDGRAPVDVQLTQSLHRTYGFGANYASDEGFGVSASWEHRNFFHGGERFYLEGRVAEIEQALISRLDVPAFLRPDQRLILDTRLAHEEPDAFTRWGADTSAIVEREISSVWTVQAGASLEYANIEDVRGKRNYYLVGGLAGLRRDTTDNLFDPTRGTRLLYSLRPYIGQQSGILQFLVNDVTGSAYWSLDSRSRYVAAARLRLGSITGAGLLRLPADKRFYAGGGASIRGYRYQSAGPLDPEGTPIGGRSLIEGGLELRVRVTDTIGVVPFLEAGKVSPDSLPNLDGRVFWGAGLGFRYYTAFAPLRLDLAIPLNKRPEDNSYQIYISLGQSF